MCIYMCFGGINSHVISHLCCTVGSLQPPSRYLGVENLGVQKNLHLFEQLFLRQLGAVLKVVYTQRLCIVEGQQDAHVERAQCHNVRLLQVVEF